MIKYQVNPVTHKNNGIAKEWAVANYYGIERTHHDSVAFNRGADIETSYNKISVKSDHFTLMSGTLCNGLTDFDAIWNKYEKEDKADKVAYVDKSYNVYEMTRAEFKSFVYTFGKLERESQKNGGQLKLRCKQESKKMIAWLDERVK